MTINKRLIGIVGESKKIHRGERGAPVAFPCSKYRHDDGADKPACIAFCENSGQGQYDPDCGKKHTKSSCTLDKEQIKNSEVVQVAVEGVDQLETHFGVYLPQFFMQCWRR